MRHKLNLPEHPNIIFLIIVFDLFVLVSIYGLYGTNWIGQSGYQLKLPSSPKAYLPISPNHLLVKVFSEDQANCIIGRKAVPFTSLSSELEQQKNDFKIEEVLLMIDENAPISRERELVSMIQALGLKCTIVTEPIENGR